MNGMCADSEKREELEAQTNRKLTEVLKETLCAAQDEKGVDLADSFRRLGGSDRSLYDRYAGDKTHYDAVINYEVKSEVTLVDTK